MTTGGNTELQVVLLRASDLTDILTLGFIFVSEWIDFRSKFEWAIELHVVLLRASDLEFNGPLKYRTKIDKPSE